MTTPTIEQLEEAKDYLDHKFRGVTIYEGHPLPVICFALAFTAKAMGELDPFMLDQIAKECEG